MVPNWSRLIAKGQAPASSRASDEPGPRWFAVEQLIGQRNQPAPKPVVAVESSSAEGWIVPAGSPTAGAHVWAGLTPQGLFRSPAGSAAIIVGPPKSGKTRKVIAPTLACWSGPALCTSTKGDLLAGAGYRAKIGPVALYDPTGSLGSGVSVGFSPLSRCDTWDGAVEVANALLSPLSSDQSVRHGEHFSTAARMLLAPLFHAAVLHGGGLEAVKRWLARFDFDEPTEILRTHDARRAIEDLTGIAAQSSGDYRTSVLGTAQVALAWASRQAVRQSTDPQITPQIDLKRLLDQNGTLYVVSPSRIQQELAPLIAALIDALCATAIDTAITNTNGRLDPPLLLALDEVANIAPIRNLPRLLSEGIQQGIVPVLGVQDMSQLRSKWGEHDAATMWSTPALRLILPGIADPYTAKLTAEACGEQLVWRPQIGQNNSTSQQADRHGHSHTDGDTHTYAQQREPTIQPADLRAMPPGRGLALPQGHQPIPLDLHHGAPGLDRSCAWTTTCQGGRVNLSNEVVKASQGMLAEALLVEGEADRGADGGDDPEAQDDLRLRPSLQLE
ncbi:MAG: type IV secretory system conjugative DNA transfer family protein, partial [Solirubrobacteraceae bacterium]